MGAASMEIIKLARTSIDRLCGGIACVDREPSRPASQPVDKHERAYEVMGENRMRKGGEKGEREAQPKSGERPGLSDGRERGCGELEPTLQP